MKAIIILILILCTFISKAQVAIIQDKDGYTNVRKQPNGNSDIIYQIKENEVFWFGPDEADTKGNWVPVFISTDKFCLSDKLFLEGFIHKSRLKPLQDLITNKNNSIIFKYSLKPFNPKDHSLKLGEGGHIETIDGKHPWGTDGNLPKIAVEAVSVSIEGKNILIPESLIKDIFECTNYFDVYQIGQTYFIYQKNSDGAGSYQLVWVITKDGVKQRLVGSII